MVRLATLAVGVRRSGGWPRAELARRAVVGSSMVISCVCSEEPSGQLQLISGRANPAGAGPDHHAVGMCRGAAGEECPQGPQGPTGPQGPAGSPGTAGRSGTRPLRGACRPAGTTRAGRPGRPAGTTRDPSGPNIGNYALRFRRPSISLRAAGRAGEAGGCNHSVRNLYV